MKRNLVSIVVAAILVLTTIVGCGGTGNTGGTGEATGVGEAAEAQTSEAKDLKAIKVAVSFPDSGLTSFEQMANNFKDILGPAANCEFVHQAPTFDADGVLNFVESQIAAGVDGLFICPPSDSVLPTIANLCEENQVYWGITFRTIVDDDIRAMCEASEYYVGNNYEDEEETGYMVGKYLGEHDVQNVAIISTTKGDTTGDAREAGLARASEEFGFKVVGEARGLAQASDVTNAVESFLSANADLDAIFVVGTTVTDAQGLTVKAVMDAGRQDSVQVVCIDHPDGIVDLFETGVLTYSVGTPVFTLDCYLVGLKLVNAIQGTPISGEVKGRSTNHISMAEVTSVEEAQVYAAAASDPKYVFFDADEISQMLGWNNPEFDEAALQDTIDNFKLK